MPWLPAIRAAPHAGLGLAFPGALFSDPVDATNQQHDPSSANACAHQGFFGRAETVIIAAAWEVGQMSMMAKAFCRLQQGTHPLASLPPPLFCRRRHHGRAPTGRCPAAARRAGRQGAVHCSRPAVGHGHQVPQCRQGVHRWRRMRAGSCPRVHSLPAAACSKAPRHACSGRTAIIPCRSFSPCNLPLQVLEVEFSSGERFAYPAEYLRVHSPAAEPRDLAGRPKVGLAGWMQGFGL